MAVFSWVADLILQLHYPGIFLLMVLESIILPLPSEAILPFAGYLAGTGQLNLWLVTVAATLGSVTGSSLSFAAGKYGGRWFLLKYGKFFLIHPEHLDKAEKWFAKYGDKTVFFGRIIPVVRHFISIPAGIAEMRFTTFLLYTASGAFVWNLLLTYAGFTLGANYEKISRYTAPFESALVILIILVIIWYIIKAIKQHTRFLRYLQEHPEIAKNFERAREQWLKITKAGKGYAKKFRRT